MRLNGCHNRADPKPSLLVQDGYVNQMQGKRDGEYVWVLAARYVAIPHRFKPGCHYDRKHDDPGCKDCRHGEKQ